MSAKACKICGEQHPRGIIHRGNTLSVRVKDPNTGEWATIATGVAAAEDGAEEKALDFRDTLEGKLASGWTFEQGLTVQSRFKKWSKNRKHLTSYKDEQQRFKTHTAPFLGSKQMDEVRPRHVREWIQKLVAKGLAPRTVHNIYAPMSTMFAEAEADGVIPRSPFNRRFDRLPKKRDSDLSWRETAIFTRAEVERLISDPEIHERRRVANALLFIAGIREGELAGPRGFRGFRGVTPTISQLS